jgi:ribose-phosphate pyrophosphokinase
MPHITHVGTLKVFSGNANIPLATDICKELTVQLGKVRVGRFADGEVDCQILENVRGCDCYVIQPTCTPTNENMMELLVMIDALRRASADRITAVMPYFGYARADRKAAPRVPITAKLVANLITTSGANRVMAIDLHAGQLQGFFDIPLDHLQGRPVFVDYIKKQHFENLVVISPDVGGTERARNFAGRLESNLVIVDKRRPRPNEAVIYNVIGEVKDKTAIIFDDLVDTGGTLAAVANAIKERGAKRVLAACTHGLLSRNAVSVIENSQIEKLLITDTIPSTRALGSKVVCLSVASILAEAMRRNHNGLSISEMFS